MERLVHRVSVDSLCADLGVANVDVLLADIQGAELSMLEGLTRTLDRNALTYLIVSTHHESISGDPRTHDRCLQWIKDHGGAIVAEHTVEESFSGDGLIAASFDPHRSIRVATTRNDAGNSLFGSQRL